MSDFWNGLKHGTGGPESAAFARGATVGRGDTGFAAGLAGGANPGAAAGAVRGAAGGAPKPDPSRDYPGVPDWVKVLPWVDFCRWVTEFIMGRMLRGEGLPSK